MSGTRATSGPGADNAGAPARRVPLDPESLPLDPGFADPLARGPAIAPERLSPESLRKRFSAIGGWTPEIATDDRALSTVPARPAAVLVPLMLREGGLQVLLTRRTQHLHDHAGQISFPGGRIEAGDAGPVQAALREANEEIGLEPERVEVLGTMPEYVTVTRYAVTPVVGLVSPPPSLRPDPFEVDETFEVPLSFLMDPANHQRRLRPDSPASATGGDLRRWLYSMPYRPPGAVSAQPYLIWGATAAMLRNLYRFLEASWAG
ncbi:MAG TPA: CoA pyrophosphatase [Burkholderiaceae bacterium]